MDSLERLSLLSGDMDLEPAEDLGCPKISSTHLTSKLHHDPVVSEAVMPNGRRIRMLKTLLTSACERNCYYCPFRAGRDFHRATLKPDEMANVFTGMHAASGTGGFLAHTLTSRIARLEVNGKPMAEIELFASALAPFEIRPIFCSMLPMNKNRGRAKRV